MWQFWRARMRLLSQAKLNDASRRTAGDSDEKPGFPARDATDEIGLQRDRHVAGRAAGWDSASRPHGRFAPARHVDVLLSSGATYLDDMRAARDERGGGRLPDHDAVYKEAMARDA